MKQLSLWLVYYETHLKHGLSEISVVVPETLKWFPQMYGVKFPIMLITGPNAPKEVMVTSDDAPRFEYMGMCN